MIRDLAKADPSESTLFAAIQRALRRNGIVRWVSSISFGMTVLALILVYASIGSAIPQLRGAIEMTEMQVFKHWVFGLLIAVFCGSLALATIVRVRWSVANLGVLTVHAGLLLLCVSAWWYFASKIEGDTLLLSPRITVLQNSGAALPGGTFAARDGETWERTMPAFGGKVALTVESMRGGLGSGEATVVARLGDAAPQSVHLAADADPIAISDKLKLQLQSGGTASKFYDRETAALYYRASDENVSHMVAVEGLPQSRERFLEGGRPILDREGEVVASVRTSPAMKIGPVSIPTGWFEHWRMPIPIHAPDLPFDVEISGYLPYLAGMRSSFVAGGPVSNPAARVTLKMGAQSRSEWLLAGVPTKAVQRILAPFEYRRVSSAEERDALFEPLVGPRELIVEIKDPPVRRRYAVSPGQTIDVEGTPYQLRITQLSADWPLMTPGFEGAVSPVAIVDVTNGEKSYSRTVVQRYPHLSQDITEEGVRLRDGPYDANIVMTYRDSERGWFLLAAGEGVSPVFGAFDLNGQVQATPVSVGQVVPVQLAGMQVEMKLDQMFDDAEAIQEPIVEPTKHRKPSVGRPVQSAIRLQFRGRGELAGWEDSRWCMFSTYPHIDADPISIRPPGSAVSYQFTYSRLEHDLGGEVALKALRVDFFPGRRNVERWRTEYYAREPGAEVREAVTETNRTSMVGRWSLFQSGAAKDHWSYTILGVGNRNGILPQVLACTMITLGCLYAFYVKPILRRRRTAAGQVISRAEASLKPIVVGPPAKQPVEVGK